MFSASVMLFSGCGCSMAGLSGVFREKTRLEVDFAIWGTPMRSSKIRRPLAAAATGVAKSSVKIPTMPNSWMPAPAGVMGTKPSAVTSGWIRKYPIQGI